MRYNSPTPERRGLFQRGCKMGYMALGGGVVFRVLPAGDKEMREKEDAAWSQLVATEKDAINCARNMAQKIAKSATVKVTEVQDGGCLKRFVLAVDVGGKLIPLDLPTRQEREKASRSMEIKAGLAVCVLTIALSVALYLALV